MTEDLTNAQAIVVGIVSVSIWVGGILGQNWILSSNVQAQESAETSELKKKIQEVIAQRHPSDTPEYWQSLGTPAIPVLQELISQTTHPYRRTRILYALSAFDADGAYETLKENAEQSDNEVVRQSALRGLVPQHGKKAIEIFKRALDNKEANTRLIAAQSLAQVGMDPELSEQDKQKVEIYLQDFEVQESTDWVLKRYRDAKKGFAAGPKRTTASAAAAPKKGWAGRWKGVWTELDGLGIRSQEAELQLTETTEGKVSGKLEVVLSQKSRGFRSSKNREDQKKTKFRKVYQLNEVKPNQGKFVGSLLNPKKTNLVKMDIPANGLQKTYMDARHGSSQIDRKLASRSWSFVGERSVEGRQSILRIRIPDIGGTLVLVRQPSGP